MKKRFILIGHPVGHSVSPSIHHAAYEQLGIDAEYEAVDCRDRSAVEAQVAAMRAGRLHGANVTVPHKQLAFELADRIDPTAEKVGVANVLAAEHGQIVAYNTDASALASELEKSVREARADTQERPYALVLGNGGAARAAVVACQLAGVTRVAVSARRFAAGASPSTWPAGAGLSALGAELLPWPDGSSEELAEVMKKTHLLVQATSAGMKGTHGGEALVASLPWQNFQRGVAYDLVYNPPVTPFLARATELGLFSCGGLGMLVGQAKDAIEIWLGRAPNQADMMRVARQALGL